MRTILSGLAGIFSFTGLASRKKRQYFLTHLILLVVGVIYIYPFLWTIGSSLKTSSDFFSQGLNPLPTSPQWHNYAEAWTRARFGVYFINTVIVTVSVVFFTILFSSMAGYVLARATLPGKSVIIALIIVTLFLPKGYTIIPIFDIIRRLGLLDTLWAIIVANVGGSMVFSTFLFMGYFQTIPKDIEEAALIDGAAFPKVYWSIMLPLAGPIAATVALFTFISTWNDFFTPLVFTQGRPELRTLAVGMYAFMGENSRDWTLICAGATISILPIIFVFIFLQRYFIDGIAGAVKG